MCHVVYDNLKAVLDMSTCLMVSASSPEACTITQAWGLAHRTAPASDTLVPQGQCPTSLAHSHLPQKRSWARDPQHANHSQVT